MHSHLFLILSIISVAISTPFRLFTIILDNTEFNDAMAVPFLNQLSKTGQFFDQYYAVAHPSQPNYLAMIGGDKFTNSDNDINLPGKSLVDLLEEKGVSWKNYNEDMPSPCFSASWNEHYSRSHNPFISFNNVRNNPNWCNKIVPAEQLDIDIANNQLPQFSFYVPNTLNNGQDTGVAFSAAWLKEFLDSKNGNRNFWDNTILIIAFDEDDGDHVYALFLGDIIQPSLDNNRHDHFSLLRFYENNWNLGNLGRRDVAASVMRLNLKTTTSSGQSGSSSSSSATTGSQSSSSAQATTQNSPIPPPPVITTATVIISDAPTMWNSSAIVLFSIILGIVFILF